LNIPSISGVREEAPGARKPQRNEAAIVLPRRFFLGFAELPGQVARLFDPGKKTGSFPERNRQ
jgi:hypothetical protein